MTSLILGLVLFFGPHLVSVLAPGVMAGLKASRGEKSIKGIYAVLSFAGVGLMIWGFRQSWYGGGGDQQLYDPPAWGRHITMLLVLLAFISLGASHGKGRLRLLIKNPMSIAFGLWSAGHLLANGRFADVLLFGSFLIYSLLDIATAKGRGKTPDYVPNSRSDVMAVVVGVILYALVLLVVHPYVFGNHCAAMMLLAFGVLIFAVLHLVPAIPGVKAKLKAATGERLYGPLYGGVSVLALLIIVLGWRSADFVPVYDPQPWGAHANFGFMLLAFMCLSIFLFRGKLRQRLRFPMGIAVVLWATGHLLANGDMRSVILFGGMLAYALIHIALGFANGVRPSPEVRGGHDLASFLFGLMMYAMMTQLHAVVIGVPVLTLVK